MDIQQTKDKQERDEKRHSVNLRLIFVNIEGE